VVAQQLYTLWVGGSNPSSPTISETLKWREAEKLKFSKKALAAAGFPVHKLFMKARIVSALIILATAGFLFAQAEQVKGKAKDLKKKVEGQTNKVDKATPPAKP
jgi:hypothetical protein